MKERDLIVVPECDDEETGEHTCWAMEVVSSENSCDGKNHYIWISKYDDKEYVVENSNGTNLTDDEKVFKTLNGAKKRAEEIAWRQESREFYTD